MDVLAGILVAVSVLLLLWPGVRKRIWGSHWVALRRDLERSQRPGILSRLLAAGGIAEMDRLCRQAGRPRGLTGQTFLVIQWAAALGAGLLFSLAGTVIFGLLVTGAIWFMARIWLRSQAEARQRQIDLELPTFLDLWALLVAGGATLEAALIEIARRHSDWVVASEMRLVLEHVATSGLLGESLVAGARDTGSAELVAAAEQLRQLIDAGGRASQELARMAARLRDERLDALVRSTGVGAIVGIFPKLFAVFLSLTPVLACIILTVMHQV